MPSSRASMPGANAPRGAPPASPAKVIGASLVGTSLEWYDFFLYLAATALVFDKLFFPRFGPMTGILLAFTTAAAGFAARPLGGIVFGHFGDRVGRKPVLVATLILMGGATFLIGLLPTYGQIGIWAPLLLGVLRFGQGIGLGGEWGGAVLMAMEHGEPDRRGLTGSWPQIGVPMGNLLATAVLGVLDATLSDQAFLSWGWRVGFLLSGALVLLGLWIRVSIAESPLFAEVERRGATAAVPLVEVIRRHPRGLLVAVGARIGTDVAFYTFTAYIIVYVTIDLGLPRSTALTAVLIASACQLVLIPLFGSMSDLHGRRLIYALGAVSAAVWVFAFFPLLSTRSSAVIVLATVIALVTHAAMYGPQAAFISELFTTELRYSGASMGYQIAGVVGGGIAPIISIALVRAFHTPFAVSGYVLATLLLTLLALWLAPETSYIHPGYFQTNPQFLAPSAYPGQPAVSNNSPMLLGGYWNGSSGAAPPEEPLHEMSPPPPPEEVAGTGRTIPHRELRNNSSAVLREVQAGETVYVSDNGEIVAALVPAPYAEAASVRIRRATRRGGFGELERFRVGEQVQDVLNELRGHR